MSHIILGAFILALLLGAPMAWRIAGWLFRLGCFLAIAAVAIVAIVAVNSSLHTKPSPISPPIPTVHKTEALTCFDGLEIEPDDDSFCGKQAAAVDQILCSLTTCSPRVRRE